MLKHVWEHLCSQGGCLVAIIEAFVWRYYSNEPFQAYSTKQWFEPSPDDKNCVWRGAPYSEAMRQAKIANREAGTSPEAFQNPKMSEPLKKPTEGQYNALKKIKEGIEFKISEGKRQTLERYFWVEDGRLTVVGELALELYSNTSK